MNDVKNYFASSNSGVGFVNHFEFINNTQGFGYILKGGPGTGKSSLMKKIAKHFENLGESIEYFWCSSDPESLDAINIKNKNVYIVDGTAPHVTEAIAPQITHQIINLGKFINPSIAKEKNKVLQLIENKKNHYTKAYKFLESAKNILDTNFIPQEINNKIVEKYIKLLKKYIKNQKKCKKMGKNRKLFICGIKKEQNFYNKNNYKNIFQIKTNHINQQKIFEKYIELLNLKGFDTISICNSLNPNLIDYIYIENLKILIKNNEKIKKNSDFFKKNQKIINILQNFAFNEVLQAKTIHKKIEEIYIKNTDFEGINQLTNDLIRKIEKL